MLEPAHNKNDRARAKMSQLAKQDRIDTTNQDMFYNMKPVKQMTPIYDP